MFLRRKAIAPMTDEELVAQLRGGDPSVLGELWDRYSHLLFGVCMKYMKDVERSKDMVVDLYTILPELLRKHDILRFRPWIHTVMRNRCLMALRSDRRSTSLPEEIPVTHDGGSEEEASLLEASLQQLEQAIAELNDGQRTCITLFHLERRNYQEISEVTGASVEQVRSHLQNGRRNLRLILERHADRNT